MPAQHDPPPDCEAAHEGDRDQLVDCHEPPGVLSQTGYNAAYPNEIDTAEVVDKVGSLSVISDCSDLGDGDDALIVDGVRLDRTGIPVFDAVTVARAPDAGVEGDERDRPPEQAAMEVLSNSESPQPGEIALSPAHSSAPLEPSAVGQSGGEHAPTSPDLDGRPGDPRIEAADDPEELVVGAPAAEAGAAHGHDRKKSRRREKMRADEAGPVATAPRRAKGNARNSCGTPDALASLMERTGLAGCKESASRFSTAEIGATDFLHQHLADVYRLDEEQLARGADLSAICKILGLPWTAATRANPGVALFKICHPGIATKRASRYATALRYCRLMNVPADALPPFLRENGGVDGCAKKFREHNGRSGRVSSRSGTKSSGLFISDAPDLAEGVHGLVIKIAGGEAAFIRTLVPPESDTCDADAAD